MSTIINHHIDHPSAWKASDFASKDDYVMQLESHHNKVPARALEQINHRNFDLDDMSDFIGQITHGSSMDAVSYCCGAGRCTSTHWRTSAIMYYGFGTHFGQAASQSIIDHRLGLVRDFSQRDANRRVYRNKYPLPLHTDLNDLLGMLNIHQAPWGRESQYASAIAVHNEIWATHRDLLAPL